MNYTSKGLYRYAGGKNKKKEELISLIGTSKANKILKKNERFN